MPPSSSTERFSGRLFYRVYFAVVICIVVIGSILDYVAGQSVEADRLTEFESHVTPVFQLLNNTLDNMPAVQWQTEVNRLSQVSGRDIGLYDSSDFSADPDFNAELETGALIALFDAEDELTFFQRMPESDRILSITAPDFNTAAVSQVWLVTTFYILVAIAIFFLFRPFARDLLKLKMAASTLGQDDFSSRIAVTGRSSLMPVLQTFNRMADNIERLVNAQRDLTNAVSHELRTPLARLKFAFEALESEQPDAINSIDAMRVDVEELESLIEEMLCYAEINQIDTLSTTIVPLHSIIAQAVESERTAETAISTRVSADCDGLLIECDSHHLIRAVRNVLRNAIRHAESQCRLSVMMESGWICVDIDDDGAGIAPEHRARIFEPFYKSDQNASEGFGLGLSIARRIMQKHLGELKLAQSNLGGACFRFSLPKQIIR